LELKIYDNAIVIKGENIGLIPILPEVKVNQESQTQEITAIAVTKNSYLSKGHDCWIKRTNTTIHLYPFIVPFQLV
jgi:hypothetical protein